MKFSVSSKIIVLLIGFCAALLVGAGSAKADFTFGTPTNLGPVVNSSANEHPAGMTADGLSLYFSSRRPGGYSGWYDIYVSTRPTRDDPWEEPVNLGPAINTVNSDFEPDITPDGLILVFVRIGTGVPDWDIWMSTRPTRDDPWGQRVNLGRTVNSPDSDMDPTISADGRTLYLSSRRPGGQGESDIWMTTRPTRNDPWAEPVNLGPPVNSSSTEACSHITADGRMLLFYSRRPGGYGDADLWMTRRPTVDHPWSEPVNLGPVINTVGSEAYAHISPDGQLLYFRSDRPGGQGGTDIWQAPIIPIVDFNGDGIVDSVDLCIMVEHWGENYSLCDIGPSPLGDGIVDVQDLLVLAKYIEPPVRIPLPLAHWAMDEDAGNTAFDSVSEYDGTLQGGPIWHPDGGRVGGALQFDGIDDYMSTPFIVNPSKGSFSVTAWIKGGAPGQVIISQSDLGRDQGNTWLMADASYGRLMTRLMHPPFPSLVSESVITDDQWHHVGLVFDIIALHRYLYVDGIEVAKDSDFVAGVGSDGGLHIGADKTLDAASFFSGLIDEVHIYNNVLSAEEIENLSL
jgi:hypothetical protein